MKHINIIKNGGICLLPFRLQWLCKDLFYLCNSRVWSCILCRVGVREEGSQGHLPEALINVSLNVLTHTHIYMHTYLPRCQAKTYKFPHKPHF